MLKVSSTAFQHNAPIPRRYTGEGEDISPPISWSGVPPGTKELALICEDPDAPREEPWSHWVVYHIPADRTSLPEGSAGGAMEGQNDFGRSGYGGPMPPPGHGTHHYHFKVWALDQSPDVGPGATRNRLLRAIQGHVIAQGELVGTYERKPKK